MPHRNWLPRQAPPETNATNPWQSARQAVKRAYAQLANNASSNRRPLAVPPQPSPQPSASRAEQNPALWLQPAPPFRDTTVVTACFQCGYAFGWSRKKHHCHNCGQVLCDECTPHRWELPRFGYDSPVRVCGLCHRLLEIATMDTPTLMMLPIRTLRSYIDTYGLPAQGLLEKAELAQLVYDSQPLSEAREAHFRSQLPTPSPAAPAPASTSLPSDPLSAMDVEEINQMIHQICGFQLNWPAPPQPPAPPSHSTPPPRSRSNNNSQTPPARPTAPTPSLASLIANHTEVASLSVPILKNILAEHCIDHSQVLEKQDLIDKVKRLVDNTRAELAAYTQEKDSDDHLCRLCFDAVINCVLLECGHMATCMGCAKQLQSTNKDCPICRQPFVRIVHVFKS
ncbi:hypothetical protein H4R34_003057 [Dimargaris verticillata]|uniref:FYVE-type domain-containing protein n=1 Tax=Dimargaris verticillata TaxID=2761393 RepID=A0A9W8ED00_9FUNG|nr:hypothetical protein H4R34_003057 [Dimargaris verticillata]